MGRVKNSFFKQNGASCTIILSGGDALANGLSEAEVYKKELLALNVENNDIVLESESLNTFKNAEFTCKILRAHAFDKIFLVTSGLHMKRALLYFSHFGINPIAAPADHIKPISTIFPLAYNFLITDLVLREQVGIARYHFYNFMHWNVAADKAGSI